MLTFSALLMVLGCRIDDQLEPDVQVMGLVVTPNQLLLPVGGRSQLAVTGLTSNHQSVDLTETVDWKVERYSVLEVSEELDGEGIVTALSEGSSRIYAEYNGLRSPFVEVFVTAAALTNIDITPEVAELMEGDQLHFRAIGSYSDGSTGPLGTDLRWITGDGEILQINDVGVATAVAPGETTVTAQYEDVQSEERAVTITSYVANGRPDLVIEDIVIREQADGQKIEVTVLNQGSRGSDACWVELYIGQDKPELFDFGDQLIRLEYLGPNNGRTISFEVTLLGATNIWALVDSQAEIDETFEGNNWLEIGYEQ